MSDRAFPPSTEPSLTPPDIRPEELEHGGTGELEPTVETLPSPQRKGREPEADK